MKIRVTNNRAPAGDRLRNVTISVDHPVMASVVLTATGGGMSDDATAEAMATHQRLRELAIGEQVEIKNQYVNLALRLVNVDVTFTRVED